MTAPDALRLTDAEIDELFETTRLASATLVWETAIDRVGIKAVLRLQLERVRAAMHTFAEMSVSSLQAEAFTEAADLLTQAMPEEWV